jgi:hypothetical protein
MLCQKIRLRDTHSEPLITLDPVGSSAKITDGFLIKYFILDFQF